MVQKCCCASRGALLGMSTFPYLAQLQGGLTKSLISKHWLTKSSLSCLSKVVKPNYVVAWGLLTKVEISGLLNTNVPIAVWSTQGGERNVNEKRLQPPRGSQINLVWLWSTTETTRGVRKRLVWRSNRSWSSVCGSSRDSTIVIIGRLDQSRIDHCRLTKRPPMLSGRGVNLSNLHHQFHIENSNHQYILPLVRILQYK